RDTQQGLDEREPRSPHPRQVLAAQGALLRKPKAAGMLRLWLLLVCLAPALAQSPDARKARSEYVRSHYAKFEYRIPMRDGKRLFTSVYVPNGVNLGQKYPIVLHRTPYSVGPYGQDRYRGDLGITEAFDQEGFIFAFQDVRGRFM